MPPTRWVETTGAIGIITKNGAGGGTLALRYPSAKNLSAIFKKP